MNVIETSKKEATKQSASEKRSREDKPSFFVCDVQIALWPSAVQLSFAEPGDFVRLENRVRCPYLCFSPRSMILPRPGLGS